VSLVARHIEANGIPTVMIANARDIVEYCGVPRLLFVDFPLGNPCGEPFKADQQRDIVSRALDLLETATEPRSTVVAPYVWPHGNDWKRLIFSDEQAFLSEEGTERWLEAKEQYRHDKLEGKV
tara:strand:+ start:1689 stop:2057 length:369 start_codon:yes stop_codon:yes gene_type:complete